MLSATATTREGMVRTCITVIFYLESVLILSLSLICVYPEEKQTNFFWESSVMVTRPAAKLWWWFVANSAGVSGGDHPVLNKKRGRKTKQK